jgi:hypothetical protein
MRFRHRSSAVALALALLVGLLAVPALAQDAVDGDGYPIDIDDDAIVLDDVIVVDDDAEVLDGAVVADPQDDAQVLGVTLALTGGQVVTLLLVGLALLGLGGAAVAASRRRRVSVDAP